MNKHSAQVVISMGDFARGLKLLKSSASLDPECPIPYVNAARAYLGMNDLVAARRQVYFFAAHLVCTGIIVQQAIATHSWNLRCTWHVPCMVLPPTVAVEWCPRLETAVIIACDSCPQHGFQLLPVGALGGNLVCVIALVAWTKSFGAIVLTLV